jgi:methylated-DNA-[protein]-cysteine S-methyltransferase
MENKYTAYYASPLGALRIQCSDTCITGVHFMTKDEPVEPASAEFPALLQQCMDELVAYFNGYLKNFTIPVYQEGTPFQQRVWSQLLAIPFGKTISYLALAKQLGDPKAIRAAASTNGKNCIAIIVPCHRVIGTHQDLVGYAGGLWRKKWLLDMETKITWGVQTLF